MSADPSEDPRTTAVEQLEQFGLSSYAARTFVALISLGQGTARDVSQVSSVPRTRVYDAVEELHERGLVDVQQTSPKRFWAVSGQTAGQTFEREFESRVERLQQALAGLERPSLRTEQGDVWTVDGQQAVTDRVREFFASARDEIVYMTVEGLLTEEILEELESAAKRGVSVKLGGVSPDVQDQIEDRIPDVTLFESLWVWSDTPAGRLLMVDGQKTLVSVLVNGVDMDPSEARRETAIWGEGTSNSLVVVLRAIFSWRLSTWGLDG